MKKMRRLSIEFLHREVTVKVDGSTLHVQGSEPDAANTAAVCSLCNCPWITTSSRTQENAPFDVGPVLRALQQSGLHVQVSPAGQLQICQRSFEKLKEIF